MDILEYRANARINKKKLELDSLSIEDGAQNVTKHNLSRGKLHVGQVGQILVKASGCL